MELVHIAVLSGAALLYGGLLPTRLRGWALMIASVFALYWLQPALTIRQLDFILPTGTLVLAVGLWLANHDPGQRPFAQRQDQIALALTAAIVPGLSLTRYLVPELQPTASRPPEVYAVVLWLLLTAAVLAGLWLLLRRRLRLRLVGALGLILLLFVALKTPPLAQAASGALRGLTGQDVSLASAQDVAWLGFSYIAFRLIHMIREKQKGKLPQLSLRQHLTYVIFFPAITAGPIDRAERHVQDDRQLAELRGLDAARFVEGGGRIAAGIFKKFVMADSLVLLALNTTNAEQVTSTAGLWLLLYGYAFRLFFDFSGYSDIAIGIGRLYGIGLPENFDRPYLKQNIAAFWQSWHITLSNWARFYIFSPLSRAFLARRERISPQFGMFAAQMATMIVIGLWHGVTATFVIWGVWHGLGLFVHRRWSDRTRTWYLGLNEHPRRKAVVTVLGVLITFHFVLLGWVWFALPDLSLAASTFLRLLGIGS